MLKNVEDSGSDKIEGYYFQDENGVKFEVVLDGITVDVGSDGIYDLTMYKKDIPRFIKVLEAAYDFKGNL